MPKRLALPFLIIFLFTLTPARTSPVARGAIPPVSYAASAPFAPGERFVYDVLLNEAKVGKAVMKVEEAILRGRAVYRLISEVKSSGFFSLIIPINDRVESYMDMKHLYSHRIEIRKERRSKTEEKVVTFDQVGHRAVQWKNNEAETFEIPPRVQDSLSSLYFFITLPSPHIGETVSIDIHESEKNGKLEVRSLYKARVTTPAGTFRTVKVETVLPKDGPLSSKGRVFIWFTDDDQRVPVLMQSETKRGLVTVLLSSQRKGERDHSLTAEAF